LLERIEFETVWLGSPAFAVEPRPTDAYGESKLAAERGLAELDLDWVSLRAVLVYGHGVPD
jgi:nucleoside-diphosphate-sugar epimerase